MTLSTVIKAIIMILMIFVCVFSTGYSIKKCDLLRRTQPRRYSEENLKKFKRRNIIHGFINIFICLMLFFVAFPQLVFFSSYKLVCVILFSIGGIIYYKFYYSVGADLSDRVSPNFKRVTLIVLATLFMIVRMMIVILAILYSITGNYKRIINKSAQQSKENYTIELESLGESKISHIEGTDQYIFVTCEDGSPKLNVCEFKEKNIIKGEGTYISVTVTTSTYVDNNRREDDPLRITTEKSEERFLFLDERDMIEVGVEAY